MGKRRYGGNKGGPDQKRRKFIHNTDLTKSKNIILCSCQKYKERECGRNLKLVFSEYIEEYLKAQTPKKEEADEDEDDDLIVDKTKNNDESKENAVSISDSIKNELADLNKNKNCEWIQGPEGLVIIDIMTQSVKASDLLQFVFDKFHPKRPDNLSPFVFKLFPLDCTSFSRQTDMIEMGKDIVSKEKWEEISKEDSRGINYKNRGNKKLDRKSIVDGIASAVPKGYKVDLKSPKTCILLQTFGRTAGISVIKNGMFQKHKEYNMSNFDL